MRLSPLVICSFQLLLARSHAESLGPGSAAPPIQVTTWVKGEPVRKFDPGKIYVVEFWATWCAPCLQAIPHLTALVRRFPSVHFLGIAASEHDNGSKVAAFVRSQGDQMDYAVGYSAGSGGMYGSWVAAGPQQGIPVAYVVQANKLAWIGHPDELDVPLDQIVKGEFDSAGYAAKFRSKQISREVVNQALGRLDAIDQEFKRGHQEAARKELANVLVEVPAVAAEARYVQFGWLEMTDSTAWRKQARAIAESGNGEELEFLSVWITRQTYVSKRHSSRNARVAAHLLEAHVPTNNVKLEWLLAMNLETLEDWAGALAAYENIQRALPTSDFKVDPDALKSLNQKIQELRRRIAKGKVGVAHQVGDF